MRHDEAQCCFSKDSTDFRNSSSWLISYRGRIYPPIGRPWKTGSGVGCLAGPLFYRQSCVDIGFFEICPPGIDGGGGGDETGPPGFPGGPIDGGAEPDGNPLPYPQPSPDEEPEPEETTVVTASPASTYASMTSASATSGSVAQYYLVATLGAVSMRSSDRLRQRLRDRTLPSALKMASMEASGQLIFHLTARHQRLAGATFTFSQHTLIRQHHPLPGLLHHVHRCCYGGFRDSLREQLIANRDCRSETSSKSPR